MQSTLSFAASKIVFRLSFFNVCALVLAGCCGMKAQAPGSAPAVQSGSRPDYTHESAVIEQMSRTYRYASDGTGSREIAAVVDIQDAAAVKNWSVLSVGFASSAEHVEVEYVRVRRADASVIETPAADAQEVPAAVTREAPFYSDLKEEQIPVRSLREGDHLEYKLRIVRTRPEAAGHFWGEEKFFTISTGAVVLKEVVELHVPATAYVQVWSPKYKAVRSTTAVESVYHWESSQLLPLAGKDKNALLRLDKEASESYEPKLPHIAWSNFHNWPEVGAWYRDLEGTRLTPDDEVRAKAKELTSGKSTEDARARAIYGFVGPQVRYIAVDFGIGRYQPHDASEVLRNQYGDCKDKHTLQESLLAAAGIPADAVLIGSGIAFNPDLLRQAGSTM